MPKLKIVKKPWGKEIWFANTKKYLGKIIIVKKGHRLSLQYHKYKDETHFLDSGLLKLTKGNINAKLISSIIKPGNSFHIPPKTVHRIKALKNSRIIEVSTSHITDVIRLQDDYRRN